MQILDKKKELYATFTYGKLKSKMNNNLVWGVLK